MIHSFLKAFIYCRNFKFFFVSTRLPAVMNKYLFVIKNKLGDRIINQLLNLAIAIYRNLSVPRRSLNYLPRPLASANN